MNKLEERVRMLEERLREVEQHPALSVPALARISASRRVEAARIAGKRSAEVRRAKNGTAQPMPRTPSERPEPVKAPNAPNDDGAYLARTATLILTESSSCWRDHSSLAATVQRVTVAWLAPFGVAFTRLGDSPAKDADLRAILEALAAGYSVPELQRAGDLGANDAAILAEDSPGPSSFTMAVLDRLLGAPGGA